MTELKSAARFNRQLSIVVFGLAILLFGWAIYTPFTPSHDPDATRWLSGFAAGFAFALVVFALWARSLANIMDTVEDK